MMPWDLSLGCERLPYSFLLQMQKVFWKKQGHVCHTFLEHFLVCLVVFLELFSNRQYNMQFCIILCCLFIPFSPSYPFCLLAVTFDMVFSVNYYWRCYQSFTLLRALWVYHIYNICMKVLTFNWTVKPGSCWIMVSGFFAISSCAGQCSYSYRFLNFVIGVTSI